MVARTNASNQRGVAGIVLYRQGTQPIALFVLLG
jgi:hypothetical protein